MPDLARHRRDWEELAALDPFWAVLADPGLRGGGWQREAFFRTGEEEVAALLRQAAELGRPARRRAALDFGCGLGRLTRALAARFQIAVGLDISEGMASRARALNADRPGCAFVVNGFDHLGLFPDARFDLVYTTLVLQHLPSPELARGYVAELVRVLRPGGLLVFRLPQSIHVRRRLQLRRRLYAGLRALGLESRWLFERGLDPLRMIAVPEPEVLGWLDALGARLLKLEHARDATSLTGSYFVTRG
jgi:SAM-dependent methyltransferase